MEAERSNLSCEYKLNSLELAMHFIIDSLTHTGATTTKQHRTQSGVTSSRGENRLSSEPTICRTMTIGRPQKSKQDSLKKQKHSFILDSQSRTITNQRRATGLRCTSAFPGEQIHSRKQSKSVINYSSPLSRSEQKMSENYQKENNMITTCKLAELMSEEGCQRRDSSSDDRQGCLHHHQPYTSSSSLSPHPSKNYYHSTGHRWTFGMALLILVIISTISTSSTVMCVPLGHQNGGGGGGGSPSSAEITHRNGLMMPNSRGWGLNENQMDEPTAPYSLLSKGQIYLPSLLNNAPMKAAATALASTDYSSDGASREGGSAIKEDQQQSNHHGTSNYHLQQFHRQQNSEESPFKHSAHIQKLLSQQKDFPLSVTSDKGLDEEEDDDDATTPTGLNEYDDNSSNTLGQSEWKTVIEPHLYVLTEWDSPPYQEQFPLLQQQRKRRNSGTGPSLSIVNPLDVLRQRLLLEIARRRMRQSHNQIIANEEILRKIGRRRR